MPMNSELSQLTTSPTYNLTVFTDAVYDCYTPNFWRGVYEVPVTMRNRFPDSDIEQRWLNKLFAKDIEPDVCSKIIERAHKMFVKTSLKKYYRKK